MLQYINSYLFLRFIPVPLKEKMFKALAKDLQFIITRRVNNKVKHNSQRPICVFGKVSNHAGFVRFLNQQGNTFADTYHYKHLVNTYCDTEGVYVTDDILKDVFNACKDKPEYFLIHDGRFYDHRYFIKYLGKKYNMKLTAHKRESFISFINEYLEKNNIVLTINNFNSVIKHNLKVCGLLKNKFLF